MWNKPRATDWEHYLFLHRKDSPRPRKSDIADRLGISSAEFSKRLNPERYQPAISDEEVAITAEMWNQSPEYVRRKFPRKAAA